MIFEYENIHGLNSEQTIGKHHEDYSAFQRVFFKDVKSLFNSFRDICNPFEEERLVTLHRGEAMGPEVRSCLATMLDINEEKYGTFRKHRIMRCDIAISALIKNNSLHLPSSMCVNDKSVTRLQQTKCEQKFSKISSIMLSLQGGVSKRMLQI